MIVNFISFFIPGIMFGLSWLSSFSEPKAKWSEITVLKVSLFYLTVIHFFCFFFFNDFVFFLVFLSQVILLLGTFNKNALKNKVLKYVSFYLIFSILLLLFLK